MEKVVYGTTGLPSKYRQNFSNNFYQNVPRGTLRPVAIDYTLPNCGGTRRSTSIASISHTHHTLWQERYQHGTPMSCAGVERKQSSKGRVCSIALAVASFVVLIIVLAIAGLALYMGISQTDSPYNAIISFSGSAKVLRGDRFLGGLEEKAKKYRRQIDMLYQNSALGPALASSAVDGFGKDGFTIYFRLSFNRKKLSDNLTNIEKALKDILLSDALSKKPIFKNVRFDPRSVVVRLTPDGSNAYSPPSHITSASNSKSSSKSKGVVLKSPKNITTSPKPFLKDEPDFNEEDLPVIQGSFKISKTEADITEKKTDAATTKAKTSTTSTTTMKITTVKESSTTSAFYKITTDKPKPTTTTAVTSPLPRSSEVPQTTSKFIGSPQLFGDAPWVPILPNTPGFLSEAAPVVDQPTYTSFTNPGLSFNFQDAEKLGSQNLKGHPIPINKIPFTTTNAEDDHFVKVDTLRYPTTVKPNTEPMKNISAIFQNLASTLEEPFYDDKEETKEISGQGHVEVVDVDVEELLSHTTKIPLVTLLPVRSNSGIGRPFRKRLGDGHNVSVENRSFPGETARVGQPKEATSNYQIMGVLNFATETYGLPETRDQHDIVRFPKMEQENFDSVNHTAVPSFFTSGVLKGNALSVEKIKQLAEISKINTNDTVIVNEAKAISSSYSINHDGLKVLTKTLNKAPNSFSKNDTTIFSKLGSNSLHRDVDCAFKCGDGKCLAETTKCNQLMDCADGKDEANCTCADYLKSQYLTSKICDGIVDCWDFSDENRCDWCEPNQYVCSNSKVCIEKEKICDGLRNCPQGDDERQCVTVAPDLRKADEFPYYSDGYLMVRKLGRWGKLCIDNFENVVSNSRISWEIEDLGKAICKSMTYQYMESIVGAEESENEREQMYFELVYTTQDKSKSKSSLSFKETSCPAKKVVKVSCQSLECGARPQAIKHIARVVGGGNAGLGAWPWQVALYKEGEFQCGATLLSDRWLLSAGHCFYRSSGEHWVARLGALRRGTNLPSPYEQLRNVIRIIVHSGYLDFGFINDISLLQMDRPVVFSDYVRPVCLPQPDHNLEDGRLCTVIGWGQLFEVGRIFPDTLQEVQIPIISTLECRKRTLFFPLYKITDDMFCAGYERGGRDACLGDSGGPLMCPEPNGRWTLYGITSNGYGCARANRPGVYTKVANYVEWIYAYVNGDANTLRNTTKIVTSCSGHRCPLGECLPERRLCNGFIECSDGSDEKGC
ncbi:serine protease nudel-like [Cylas formicarius]|uniref:serine protease nudel-like n=1 Tax=Cylas formicarius TaxID=197179 RepID=UPI0029586663|nr:serine protease nudel-like [Cylas formicarius]